MAGTRSIYDLAYLRGNLRAGEGFDWYYASAEDRDAHVRAPITDGAGKPWVFRYKAGVTGAMRLLQRAVDTDADGEIGPNTRAAIARLPVDETLRRYAETRRARYRELHHFWRFGRGWLARVDKTLARAVEIARSDAGTTQHPGDEQKGPTPMTNSTSDQQATAKWWGQSITIWGAIITGLSTVLPALGPAFGIDITGDLVREAGAGIVQTVQAVGGLLGTIMTIYGRVRATRPLEQRYMQLKV